MSKNNEKILIKPASNFYSSLKGKHILLDTSVFIDASNHPTEFGGFFNECRRNLIGLTTSLCDFSLGAMVKKFNNLFLLTKNVKDFPATIFRLQSHLIIQMNRALQIYGVYSYKEE